MSASDLPLGVFRFYVGFQEADLNSSLRPNAEICSGAFSEVTGLEATMEPKTFKEGGNNYGAVHRAGPVTFATVILKRGMTTNRELWQRFNGVASGGYAKRLKVTITMFGVDGKAVMSWVLDRALPVKFKTADLNAKSSDVGIEELHLAHEGLLYKSNPARQQL